MKPEISYNSCLRVHNIYSTKVLKILLFGGKSYKILNGRKKAGFPFSWE